MIASCSPRDNNFEKAKVLVKDDLSKSLNDFNSYESVEFGKLDSVFSQFDDPSFHTIDTSSIENQNLKKIELEKRKLEFKPDFIGFKLTHSFRGNNLLGNKVISHYVFYFDKDLTKVTNREEL